MQLKNKVIAISGAAGLIGAAFARAVVQEGAFVLLADVAEEKGGVLASELGADRAVFVKTDVTCPDDVDMLVAVAIKRFGSLDAAVHSAYPRSSQWGTRFEDLQADGISIDLFSQLGGAILFSQRVIQHFYKVGGGSLVHVSSVQGLVAPKFEHYSGTTMVSPIEYSAIKSGIIAVTRYLAKYCKGKNIRVNCISPGGVLDGQPDAFVERYRASCLTKGMLDPSDLTGALVFLLSERSGFVNGQNIVVDDGWSL
jgi:NAD(P)-dependent dehydrogenase (short-subunit alcohol dehydrogenase family)